MLFWLECVGVARDSIALKAPTPSIDAEGVGPVEMATHIVQSIRLQLTQPTHGPYLRSALKCKRHLQASSLSAHLMYGHCDSHDLSHREYFAVHHSSAERLQSWWNPAVAAPSSAVVHICKTRVRPLLKDCYSPTWGATTLPFNGGPVPIWPGAKLLNLIKSMYWGCLGILGQAQAIIILLAGRPPRSHRSFGRPPIK